MSLATMTLDATGSFLSLFLQIPSSRKPAIIAARGSVPNRPVRPSCR